MYTKWSFSVVSIIKTWQHDTHCFQERFSSQQLQKSQDLDFFLAHLFNIMYSLNFIIYVGEKYSLLLFFKFDSYVMPTDIFEMAMKQVVQGCRDRNNPVIKFKTPEELQSLINFQLTSDGVEHSELLQLCNKAIDHSVLTGKCNFSKLNKTVINLSLSVIETLY